MGDSWWVRDGLIQSLAIGKLLSELVVLPCPWVFAGVLQPQEMAVAVARPWLRVWR